MNKTIEEAIKDGWNICDKAADMGSFDFYNTGFLNGVAHLRSLPLRDRLTSEEKERVMKMYNDEARVRLFYQKKANSCCNQLCKQYYEASRDIAKGRAIILTRIFGADFFKEEE